jgi:hypothetical protein
MMTAVLQANPDFPRGVRFFKTLCRGSRETAVTPEKCFVFLAMARPNKF